MCWLGLWRKWDALDDFVLLGSLPSDNDLRRLKTLNVRAVVNLCKEVDEAQRVGARGMAYLWLPTLDYHSPSLSNLARGVAFAQEAAARGDKVYFHCKAGRGRSAALGLCYLMAQHGLTLTQADARLHTARPHASRRLTQYEPVREFARSLVERSNPGAPLITRVESPTSRERPA